MEQVVSACESSILVWRRLRGTALSASQESTTSSLKPSALPAIFLQRGRGIALPLSVWCVSRVFLGRHISLFALLLFLRYFVSGKFGVQAILGEEYASSSV